MLFVEKEVIIETDQNQQQIQENISLQIQQQLTLFDQAYSIDDQQQLMRQKFPQIKDRIKELQEIINSFESKMNKEDSASQCLKQMESLNNYIKESMQQQAEHENKVEQYLQLMNDENTQIKEQIKMFQTELEKIEQFLGVKI